MPMLPLKELASVRMGITLRGRDATEIDANGSYRMIQISDLLDNGTFRSLAFSRVKIREKLSPDQLLCPSDILFPNRGSRTTAVVFEWSDLQAFVGAQFFIIKPDLTQILPKYLAWTLRTAEAFNYFEMHRRGSNVLTLQKSRVENFLVPLPSIEIQHTIVSLAELEIEAKDLEKALSKMRSKLLEESLLKKVKNY